VPPLENRQPRGLPAGHKRRTGTAADLLFGAAL